MTRGLRPPRREVDDQPLMRAEDPVLAAVQEDGEVSV
jgi:hypothetical protein